MKTPKQANTHFDKVQYNFYQEESTFLVRKYFITTLKLNSWNPCAPLCSSETFVLLFKEDISDEIKAVNTIACLKKT